MPAALSERLRRWVTATPGGLMALRLLTGAAAGVGAVAFRELVSLRPAAGGAVLGCLLLVVPQLYGVGYPVLEHAVEGRYAVLAVLGLMAGKMLATSLTLAIGGSGGVFAPSLFIGAMLGTAYGPYAPGEPAACGTIRTARSRLRSPRFSVRTSTPSLSSLAGVVVGWVTRRDILRAYERSITVGGAAPRGAVGPGDKVVSRHK
jgi:CBS domain-containing protein